MEIDIRIMVLIPVYMPGDSLIKLCRQLVGRGFRVTVVNDGSGQEYNYYFNMLPAEVVVLNHIVNCGKGRALKTGLLYIHRNFPSILGVVTADADGQQLLRDITAKSISTRRSTDLISNRFRFVSLPKKNIQIFLCHELYAD